VHKLILAYKEVCIFFSYFQLLEVLIEKDNLKRRLA